MLIKVNPARAGMIRGLAAVLVVISGKPRASGDDPSRHSEALPPTL